MLRVSLEEIMFPVKHYEYLFDRLTNIPHLLEPSKKELFTSIFGKYINKYNGQSKELQVNFIRIGENVVS